MSSHLPNSISSAVFCLLDEGSSDNLVDILLLDVGQYNNSAGDISGITDYIIKYSKSLNDIVSKRVCIRKTLVFRCHELRAGAGGFGDRIRGMIFSFYLSLVFGFSLKFRWDQPNEIARYFTTIDETIWSFAVPPEHHGDHYHFSRIGAFSSPPFESRNFAKEWKDFEVVELTTNAYEWSNLVNSTHQASHVSRFFPFLRHLDHFELAHLALSILFHNGTAILHDQYKAYMEKLLTKQQPSNAYFIGIQHRIGDVAFGMRTHRHKPETADKFGIEAVDRCLAHVNHTRRLIYEKMHNSSDPLCVFFITADSLESQHRIEAKIWSYTELNNSFRIFYTEGQPEHIALVPPTKVHHHTTNTSLHHHHHHFANETTVLKTYLDWYILSKMDLLIVSRSGFGETAVWRHLPKAYVYTYNETFHTYPTEKLDYTRRLRDADADADLRLMV